MAKRQSKRATGRIKKDDEEKNGKRYIVTLSGFAAEIWEAIPKSARNVLLRNLLIKAKRCGELDLFLTRPVSDPEIESAIYESDIDTPDIKSEFQENSGYSEFQRIDSPLPKGGQGGSDSSSPSRFPPSQGELGGGELPSRPEGKSEITPVLREEEDKEGSPLPKGGQGGSESEGKESETHEEPDWLRDLDRKIARTINFR